MGGIGQNMLREHLEDLELSKKNKPKLLIIGNMRHGKDSFAEILNEEFGYTFESSSQSAANIFLLGPL